MEQADSFKKLPARLKAIIFTAEQLNMDPLKIDQGRATEDEQKNKEWMTSRDIVEGARNKRRKGSTSPFSYLTLRRTPCDVLKTK